MKRRHALFVLTWIVEIWGLLRDTVIDFQRHRGIRMAAALAFYSALSLMPALIIAMHVAGTFWSARATAEEIAHELEPLFGPPVAKLFGGLIDSAGQESAGGVAAFGLVMLILAADAVFSALHDSLNEIWDVPPPPTGRLFQFVTERLMTGAVMVAATGLLLASATFSAIASYARQSVPIDLPGTATLWQLGRDFASLTIFTVMFAVIFKWVPNVRMRWRDAAPGAIVTAVLFACGNRVIGTYLIRGTTVTLYGAAGSLLALLIWVYYSAIILFFGAELARVWVRRGAHTPPED